MTEETWMPEVGERVALYDDWSYHGGVKFVTVERLTATQIVFDNGRRFRVKDLREVGDNDWRGPQIRRVDDPDVLRTQTRQIVREVAWKVSKKLDIKPGSFEEADTQLADAIYVLQAARTAINDLRVTE